MFTLIPFTAKLDNVSTKQKPKTVHDNKDTIEAVTQIVAVSVVLLIIALVGYLFLSKLRRISLQKEHSEPDLLQFFREMKSEGVLDGDEFRIISDRLDSSQPSKRDEKIETG
ncbi:MAG: hypothetical protein LBU65_08610 [Planctomycetaceae bacterium]|jgi:hypothetical protein|nr:hypothetical protein [Planctomycetaceae bacterium]